MEPLGWDEIVSQPGMGGYLSFLNGPVPLPHLQGAATAAVPDPGVISDPQVAIDPEVNSSPASEPIPEILLVTEAAQMVEPEITPDLTPYPGVLTESGVDKIPTSSSAPQFAPDPVVDSYPVLDTGPQAASTPASASNPRAINKLGFDRSAPEVVSIPVVSAGRIRVRRCAATHDGHSLGEEVLYQALWKAAQPESADTRTITIGWRGMSQLCRMTPKNCKINTQRLLRKLALEVLSPYNTPESIGTTYRVYADEAILQRRRAAGLEWVVRSRGVEFVDPATGISILPTCAHTYQSTPPLR